MAERLAEDTFTAMDEQSVDVPGTDAATLIVPSLANSIQTVFDQHKLLATGIEELCESHPLGAHRPAGPRAEQAAVSSRVSAVVDSASITSQLRGDSPQRNPTPSGRRSGGPLRPAPGHCRGISGAPPTPLLPYRFPEIATLFVLSAEVLQEWHPSPGHALCRPRSCRLHASGGARTHASPAGLPTAG